MTHFQLVDEFRNRRFTDVGHARVCYRKAGEGPALVLLRGFPISGLTWQEMVFPSVAGFWSIPRGRLFVQEEQPDTVAELAIEFLTEAA